MVECCWPGDGPISNSNTASPVVGDGTANSASGEMIHSPFTPITLSANGDKIVFTGTVNLIGTVNSAATSATPRTQFRFGLFHDDGDGDDLEWIGYYMSNKHGNAGTPAGVLARKPVGNTTVYLSATGQNQLASVQGDGTAASLFQDSLYSMSMVIQRTNNDLLISATLTGTNGFTQTLSATDTTASTLGTYTFDRVGFLLGNNLGTDQATFTNLDVAFIPNAPLLTITKSGDQIEVTWPESAISYVLQSAPSLNPTITWSPVAGSSTTNRIVQQISSGPQFYRLQK